MTRTSLPAVASRTKAPTKGTPQYEWWLEERRAAAQSLEAAFWRDVALPLSLRGFGLPRCQYEFMAGRKFRLDAAYVYARLGIEIDGGLWLGAQGGHTSGRGSARDREKGNELACAGWRLIRLTRDMLADGRALEYVERALRAASHTNTAA